MPNPSLAIRPQVILDHAADFYNCYPGDLVTLYTRLIVKRPVAKQVQLRVRLPAGLTPSPETDECLADHEPKPWRAEIKNVTEIEETKQVLDDHWVCWDIEGAKLKPKQRYYFKIKAKVGPLEPTVTQRPLHNDVICRKSWAEVRADDKVTQSKVVSIRVVGKADSLRYLPAVYHSAENELLWRYLITFDFVWQHYDELLDNQASYFDPYLAPPNFQRWLASWVGLVWDKQTSETVRQQMLPKLIGRMCDFNRQHGTRVGLQKYLQVWMGVKDEEVEQRIQIEERVAGNFVLGKNTQLSVDLRLGSPAATAGHFTVILQWPDPSQTLPKPLVKRLIDTWKPAHTCCHLHYLTGENSPNQNYRNERSSPRDK